MSLRPPHLKPFLKWAGGQYDSHHPPTSQHGRALAALVGRCHRCLGYLKCAQGVSGTSHEASPNGVFWRVTISDVALGWIAWSTTTVPMTV